MLKSFLKRHRYFKSVNALDLVPVPLVKFELSDAGRIKLLVPRFRNKILKKLFANRLSPEFKISLDETGSSVWLLIDSQKSVGKIAKQLTLIYEEKGAKLDSADERVAAFISKLYRENYIDFKGLVI